MADKTNGPGGGSGNGGEFPLERPGSLADSLGLRSLRGGVMTSLDPAKPDDREILYGAMMGESETAEDNLNKELSVRHIVTSPAQSTDAASGEIQTWVRCVLVLADGRRVAFGSLGILKSLAVYAMCFTPPPWEPPAKFTLKSTPIGKNRWYTLEQVKDEQPLPKFRK